PENSPPCCWQKTTFVLVGPACQKRQFHVATPPNFETLPALPAPPGEKAAVGRGLDSRNQARRFPHSRPARGLARSALHAQWLRLHSSLSQDRGDGRNPAVALMRARRRGHRR